MIHHLLFIFLFPFDYIFNVLSLLRLISSHLLISCSLFIPQSLFLAYFPFPFVASLLFIHSICSPSALISCFFFLSLAGWSQVPVEISRQCARDKRWHTDQGADTLGAAQMSKSLMKKSPKQHTTTYKQRRFESVEATSETSAAKLVEVWA